MAETLPAPLVPAEVNLRGMPWMPVETVRLLDSDLFALSTGDEFKAAVALWCKSWLQEPAASLPDDDRVLAHLSGAGSRWKKVRAMALRGFVKCSDGRLYHPVIAEKAIEAWERREEWEEKKSNHDSRQKRWRERLKETADKLRSLGVAVPAGANMETLGRLLRDAEASTSPSTDASTSPSTVDASEMGKRGTGTGTGILKSKAGGAASSSERASNGEETAENPRALHQAPSAMLAVTLRKLGCEIASSHPLAVQWANDGVTADMATRAMAIARGRPGKDAGNIPPGYLAPILVDLAAQPTVDAMAEQTEWQPPEVRNAR